MVRHTVTRVGFALASAFVASVGFAESPPRAEADETRNAQMAQSPQAAIQTTRRRASGLERARQLYADGSRISLELSLSLDEARRRRDRRWIRCLDDKVAQINATLRVAELRYDELEQAVEASDNTRVRRLLSIFEVLRERILDLELEASACPGSQTRVREGRTQVRVYVEPWARER
jgi:hypothetical protein